GRSTPAEPVRSWPPFALRSRIGWRPAAGSSDSLPAFGPHDRRPPHGAHALGPGSRGCAVPQPGASSRFLRRPPASTLAPIFEVLPDWLPVAEVMMLLDQAVEQSLLGGAPHLLQLDRLELAQGAVDGRRIDQHRVGRWRRTRGLSDICR